MKMKMKRGFESTLEIVKKIEKGDATYCEGEGVGVLRQPCSRTTT